MLFREAIEHAGIKTERHRVNGFLPDFTIGSTHFFQLRQHWFISDVVKRRRSFTSCKGKNLVGFIASTDFLEQYEILCMDWVAGSELPLLYFNCNKLFRLFRNGGKWTFTEYPINVASDLCCELPF